MTVRALSLSACLLASLTGINLPAGQISPGFSAAGDMTVIQRSDRFGGCRFPTHGITGDDRRRLGRMASSLDAATTTIDGWNRSTESVGSDFDPAVFIYFDAEATMPTLGNIVGGADPASACSASLSAVVRACRPIPQGAAWRGTLNAAGNPLERLRQFFQFRRQSLEQPALCRFKQQPLVRSPAQRPAAETGRGTSARGSPGRSRRWFPISRRTVRLQKLSPPQIIAVTTKVDPDGGYMLGSGLGLIFLALGSRRLFGKRQAKLDWGGREERPPTSRGLRAIIGLPDESARIRFS